MNDKPYREIIHEILTDHGLQLERDPDGETFHVIGRGARFHIPQDEAFDEETVFVYFAGGSGESVVGIRDFEAKLPGFLGIIGARKTR